MRLIDADALEEKMRDRQFFYKSVKAAPTIDAAPMVRGKWIYGKNLIIGLTAMNCSVCDTESVENFNYCPYCGAKMEVDTE